jgi:hypothetical protein
MVSLRRSGLEATVTSAAQALSWNFDNRMVRSRYTNVPTVGRTKKTMLRRVTEIAFIDVLFRRSARIGWSCNRWTVWSSTAWHVRLSLGFCETCNMTAIRFHSRCVPALANRIGGVPSQQWLFHGSNRKRLPSTPQSPGAEGHRDSGCHSHSRHRAGIYRNGLFPPGSRCL